VKLGEIGLGCHLRVEIFGERGHLGFGEARFRQIAVADIGAKLIAPPVRH
jgi:hypothetical protein